MPGMACSPEERRARSARLKAGGLGMRPVPEDQSDSDDDDPGAEGEGHTSGEADHASKKKDKKKDDENADGSSLQQVLDGMAELVAVSPLCASMLSGGRVVSPGALRRLVRMAAGRPVEGAIFFRAVVLMTMWHAVQPASPGVDDGPTLWYATDLQWRREVAGSAECAGVDVRSLIGSRVFPYSPGVARGLRRLALCRYVEEMLPLAAVMLGASVPSRQQLTQETSCAVAASIGMFVPVASVGGSGSLTRLLARCASAADQLCHRGLFDAEAATAALTIDAAPLVYLRVASYASGVPTSSNAGHHAIRATAYGTGVLRGERLPLHSCAAASMQAASNRTVVVLPAPPSKKPRKPSGDEEEKAEQEQEQEQEEDADAKTQLMPLPVQATTDDGYEPAGVCIGDDGLGEAGPVPAFGSAGSVYLRCLLRQTHIWQEQYLCKPRDQASLPRSSALSHWAWADAIERVRLHCQALLE
jgi:hypothetical protein